MDGALAENGTSHFRLQGSALFVTSLELKRRSLYLSFDCRLCYNAWGYPIGRDLLPWCAFFACSSWPLPYRNVAKEHPKPKGETLSPARGDPHRISQGITTLEKSDFENCDCFVISLHPLQMWTFINSSSKRRFYPHRPGKKTKSLDSVVLLVLWEP